MLIELPATPMRQLFSARPRFRNWLQAPEVAAWAALAAAEHTWLILTYHDVVTSGGSAYSTTSAQLDEQLSAIQSQGLAVVTVQEALSELLPQLQSDA